MSDDPLDISTIFKALSRPAMFMGVDYDYFFISGLVIMLVFIYSGSFFAFLLFFPLHMLGWILCRIDPYIFKLISARAGLGAVKNKGLWQCQSYEAY